MGDRPRTTPQVGLVRIVISIFSGGKILVRELVNFEQRKGERSQQGDLLAKATRLDVQHTRLNKAARRRAKKAREEAKAARAIQQRTQQRDGPMQEATQEMMNTHQPSGICSPHWLK
jgi:septal ring factor EnvC (AmiA/AmiB activator)